MIVLPTKNRPDNLRRFINAYMKTGATLPIHVIFDADDAGRYDSVATPKSWKRVSAPAGTPIGAIFNRIFKKYPNEPFYAMVADDVVPETDKWDVILRDACLPDKISWGWDGIQNEMLPVHPFIGGDLVRKLGWWAPPDLNHWFVDNAWKAIADGANCAIYLPDVKMTHHHFSNGKAQIDRTYEQQPNHQHDADRFIEFMKNDFPKVMERIA